VRVTVDTVAHVSVAKPDISAGWLKRQPNQRFSLQTVSREALPILKGVFLTVTLGRDPLTILVFAAGVTNELIMRLDILRTYNASVDLGSQNLRLEGEELSLWSPGAGPRP
jgi:hypothetical protein